MFCKMRHVCDELCILYLLFILLKPSEVVGKQILSRTNSFQFSWEYYNFLEIFRDVHLMHVPCTCLTWGAVYHNYLLSSAQMIHDDACERKHHTKAFESQQFFCECTIREFHQKVKYLQIFNQHLSHYHSALLHNAQHCFSIK